ncbi:MAG TPA: hypothetical protein VE646_04560 [Actinomycetota bacterium]|jgi:hypothetical protein|nr:hypothetical protein [Actinomycetota bacterium]
MTTLKAELRGEMGRVREDLHGEMGLREDLRVEMGELRDELRGETGELRGEFRTEQREGFSGVREELLILRSDLTQVALAVGARPRAGNE